MKVLITGATGFLGSHLCRRMVTQGHQIRILCRPTSNLEKLGGLPLEKAIGDVTDTESVRRATEGCEAVIHAAADLNYWRQDPAQQMRVNVEGTRNVAQAARKEGVRRLVCVSSVAAIGITPDRHRPADEDFPFNLEKTKLAYHISKWRAEEALLAEVREGLDAVIVNPASIQSEQRTRALLEKVRRQHTVLCFSGGNCVVDVRDVVEGIVTALSRGERGQRYILGGENLTFREQAEKAAAALSVQRRYVLVPRLVTGLGALVFEPLAWLQKRPPRFAYMIHYCANRFQFFDSSKARRALGYEPRDFNAILEEALPFLARGEGGTR